MGLATKLFGGTGLGGDVTIRQSTDVGLSFSITYEYQTPSEVPVPAALPLFLGGLGAMVWAARRRKQKAEAA
ncbi:VPLPA-CTERM sorting domain-containing protein [Pseudorhodoplanes sp.]|uniref:VPLPA-CTERM sorting domain-containing protein n=1 Tax=Pseudorhodoplanes sp. TaxID=1934341 RepID=UPI003918EE63